MNWQDDAICSQTDLAIFFPNIGESTQPAKRVCARCPVIVECRDFALTHDERFGIWGGLSERERQRERKRLGLNDVCRVCMFEPVRRAGTYTCQGCASRDAIWDDNARARVSAA